MSLRPFPLFLVLAALIVPVAAQAAEPLYLRDLGAYMRHLERSRDPKVTAILGQIASGPVDLERERAAARREGLPLTRAELAYLPPPVDQDATPIYERLERMWKEKPLDPAANNLSSGSLRGRPAADIEQVRRMFAERPGLMVLVLEATDRPRAYFPFPKEGEGSEIVPFPNFARLREVARKIKAYAFVLAHEGRYDEAIAVQARGFRVAAHAGEYPTLIGYLVATAVEAITLAGMEDILHLAGPNAEIAAKVRRAVGTHRGSNTRAALRGEFVYVGITMAQLRAAARSEGVGALRSLLAGPDENGDARPPAAPKSLTPEQLRFLDHLWAAAEADTLRRLRGVHTALGKPFPQRPRYKEPAESLPANPVEAVSQLLVPVFGKVGEAEARSHARRETVLAGAALLAYRARQGEFPARLDQALPEPPADPFTGKPLRYRREKDGFVVYSVGPTGKFGGGKPGERNGGEALFRYSHRPAE